MKTKSLILGIFASVALLALAGCGGKEEAKSAAEERVSGVRVEAV